MRLNSNSVRLNVRLHPKASDNRVDLIHSVQLRVHVTASPEHGNAKEARIVPLSNRLSVSKNNIKIVLGLRVRDKVVTNEGLRVRDVSDRLGTKRIGEASGEQAEAQL